MLLKTQFIMNGENFHVRIICGWFYKKEWNFDSLMCDTLWIQEYGMVYISFYDLLEFLRLHIKHKTTNYKVDVEDVHIITIFCNKLIF